MVIFNYSKKNTNFINNTLTRKTDIIYISFFMTIKIILNEFIAFNAWGILAGMIILCPQFSLKISSSIPTSVIVTKASPGEVCSLIDSPLSKEKSVTPTSPYWTNVLLATLPTSKFISSFNSKIFCALFCDVHFVYLLFLATNGNIF